MTLRSVVASLLEEEARWAAEPGKPRGVPTGFPSLDALTSGLRRGEVTVLAARTSHGKSSLSLAIAVHAAEWEIAEAEREGRHRRVVLYVSPEMTAAQLVARVASQRSGVSLSDIEWGRATPEQREAWRGVLADLAEYEDVLVIEAGRGFDWNEVEALVRTYHATRGVVLVVIDYLQRLSYGVIEDEYRRVSAISQGCKDLANELGIPILLVSQLNRQVAKERTGGRNESRLPDLSDLRGSGRIEEDADNVWLLWREPRFSAAASGLPQDATLIVAKARSGRVGEIRLWFYPETVRFADTKMTQRPQRKVAETVQHTDVPRGDQEERSLAEAESWYFRAFDGTAESDNDTVVLFRRKPVGRRRGYEFEKRLAKRLGGYRWPGHDGDIEWRNWRIEAKYRRGLVLRSTDELKSWLEQVYGYQRKWEPGKRWAIAVTGGSGYRRGAVYVILPLEAWVELVEDAGDASS